MNATDIDEQPETAWSPLGEPLFRALWIASLASNVGSWIQDIGSGWLMTSLTSSALMVALVQTAKSMPMFLLALPAGALADVLDRRKVLLGAQIWMFLVAGSLGAATWLGIVTDWMLLGFTMALGVGFAVNMPAWQSVVPELVKPKQLASAVTLGGISVNLSRSVGPAIGGIVIAAFGAAAAFFLNAISFLAVIIVVARWKPARQESSVPSERFFAAMRTGVRHVRHSPELRSVLARAVAFILFGSAIWAFIPLIARSELDRGPGAYGAMLGFMGAGAVVGGLILPRLRENFSSGQIVQMATIVIAVAMLGLAWVRVFYPLLGVMFVIGVGWTCVLATLNVSAQVSASSWVRGRALAIYTLTFFGGMALGSVTWGVLADQIGIARTLSIASGGMLVGLSAALLFELPNGDGSELVPSMHWPAPNMQLKTPLDAGPVIVTIEYLINVDDAAAFENAMQPLRLARMRDGAYRWRLYRDIADETRFVEIYLVETWGEHQRQHKRVTEADRRSEECALRYHIGAELPKVSHLILARSLLDVK